LGFLSLPTHISLIRLATSADVPAMMALDRACITAAHWTEEQYLDAFDRGGIERLALVAEALPSTASDEAKAEANAIEARGLQGFLVARHVAAEWELENIVVAPSARRRGLGQQLLDALLAAARETSSCAVSLEVRESNTAARKFYERAGFAQTGRRKSYYANPAEDAVVYRASPVPRKSGMK
jgi:[ribosomal protein S18]-alanine N-acetyltransferase